DVGVHGEGGLALQFEFTDHALAQGSHVSSSLGKGVEMESPTQTSILPPLAADTPAHEKARPFQAGP
ncbi:MAG TPA: hypothetical protein VNH11_26910, partial [Pirellulales bacterium]|nr:hypothetical protein [Pirellulales bacterium]